VRVGQEIQALARDDRLSADHWLNAGMTRGAALLALRRLLTDACVEDSAVDARLLLCAAENISAGDLILQPDFVLDQTSVERLAAMAARRAAREPVSRILARREFWGLPLAISPAVLDPRPDSETVVAAAIAAFAHRRESPLRILDLGVGSGAILCALLTEFNAATGIGVDLSAAAAEQARANLAACGLAERSTILIGGWRAAVGGRFDIAVSNPPYVPSQAVDELEPEVRDHDPRLALDGGPDGLEAYRAIAPELAGLLAADGRFFLEVGAGQAQSVLALLSRHGLAGLAAHADLAGVARVVEGRAAEAAPRGENN
jgi:release factor glutamine methyltransferase